MPMMTRGVFEDTWSTDHYAPVESYRIPRRNEIAQRDERGVNPLQGENLIAGANTGSDAWSRFGTAAGTRRSGANVRYQASFAMS
jgi:hypothetical protein